jgi:hypothetical protein
MEKTPPKLRGKDNAFFGNKNYEIKNKKYFLLPLSRKHNFFANGINKKHILKKRFALFLFLET